MAGRAADHAWRLHTFGAAHTRGDQIVFLPEERILIAGDLIEERMFPIFPWFPPNDTDVDGARWVEVLNGFRRFNPTLVVPGHGDPGGIGIALALASQIGGVGRRVRALRTAGMTAVQRSGDHAALARVRSGVGDLGRASGPPPR